MRKFSITSVLFLIVLLSNCNSKHSELEFEKKVMAEIYPSLIDSIWVVKNASFLSSVTRLNESNESESSKTLRANSLETLAKIKKDTTRIHITIATSIIPIEPSVKKDLSKHFKNAVLPENNPSDTLSYSIDTTKFNAVKNLKVKFTSSPKKKFEFTSQYNIIGIIRFSRIQFDRDKKYGVLTATLETGFANFQGYTIFIKKSGNQWIIDKFEATWIT